MRKWSLLLILLALCLPSLAQAQTWPNEPSGATVLSDHDFTVCEANGWTGNCGAIVSDATAPVSPTDVMRYRYNPATGSGGGELWILVNQREFYLAFWHKLSNPFQGAENGSNKVIFSFTDDSIAWYLKWQGAQGTGQFYPSFSWTTAEPQNDTYLDNCHITQNFYIADPIYPCLLRQWNAPTPVPLGQWFFFEMRYKASSSVTQRDGFVTYWLNGTKILDVQQLNTPNANVSQLFFTPTWTPPIDRSNPDEMRWDHVRVSYGGTPGGGVDTTPPSQVTGLTATPQTTSVVLNWTASTDNSGIAPTYDIERCSASGCNTTFTNIHTTGNTTYTDSGLTASTLYGYRIRARDGSGNLAPYSSVVQTTTGAAPSGSTVLGLSGGGYYTLNGVPTFLLGISYYDAATNWYTSDLDSLAADGFNLIVVHCDDINRVDAESCYNSDGTIKSAKATLLNNLIDYAETKGIVVDMVCLYADVDGTNSAAYLTTAQARTDAVTNCINTFKAQPNVMFSVVNEHNYGSFADTHAEMDALMATARAACASCLIHYSSSDNIGVEADAHIFTTRSGWTVDTANVQAELASGVNALVPHNDRQAGWHLLGGARAGALRNYLDSIGRQSMPVFFEEDAREGSGGTGVANDYLTYAQEVKIARGAGYVFHTAAGFDLSTTAMYAQLTGVEPTVVDTIAAAVASVTALSRDTATFTETCTGTAADIGASWDAGYGGHNAWQKVSDRCRTAGLNLESLESYNGGTITTNAWIEADTPTFAISGTYSEVRLGFYSAPATVNGYECRFGLIPSGTVRITRKDNNSPSTLASVPTTIAPTAKKACERVGSTITAKLDNVTVATATDTTYPDVLRPGFYGYSDGSATDIEVDNISLGNFTTASTYVTPRITDAVVSGTGATVTWTGSIASIRVLVGDNGGGFSSSVIEPIANFPGGVYTRSWVSPEEFVCFFARDANGVENTNPSDYQCRATVIVADTTPPVLSNPLPSGQLPAGTTSTLASITTNENATCKWSTTDQTYSVMPNTFSTTGGTLHTTTFTGLVNNTAYTRYVRCQDIAGNPNIASTLISFSVAAAGGDTTPPSTVANLAAVVLSNSQIRLTWTPATDNVLVAFYRIYRCDLSDCSTAKTVIATPEGQPYILSGLTQLTTYVLAVTAVDSSNNESAALSNIVVVVTADPNDPVPPAGVSVASVLTLSSIPVRLSWTAASDNVGLGSYIIERCEGSETCTTFASVGTSSTTFYIDRTAQLFTLYRYRVLATDLAGNVSTTYSPVVLTYPTFYSGTPREGCSQSGEGC